MMSTEDMEELDLRIIKYPDDNTEVNFKFRGDYISHNHYLDNISARFTMTNRHSKNICIECGNDVCDIRDERYCVVCAHHDYHDRSCERRYESCRDIVKNAIDNLIPGIKSPDERIICNQADCWHLGGTCQRRIGY
jgi:hypothetical protein